MEWGSRVWIPALLLGGGVAAVSMFYLLGSQEEPDDQPDEKSDLPQPDITPASSKEIPYEYIVHQLKKSSNVEEIQKVLEVLKYHTAFLGEFKNKIHQFKIIPLLAELLQHSEDLKVIQAWYLHV